jgi:hypothetical protein
VVAPLRLSPAIVKRLLEETKMAEHWLRAALDALVDTDTLEMICQMIIHSAELGRCISHALLPLLPACMALVHHGVPARTPKLLVTP